MIVLVFVVSTFIYNNCVTHVYKLSSLGLCLAFFIFLSAIVVSNGDHIRVLLIH